MKTSRTRANKITAWQVFKYAAMPAIMPRIRELLSAGFSYISYFIALVYQAVRLLPAGHPYLDARNIGKFGIRHVVAAAANNLIFDRKHIDQIVVFTVILVGLVITFFEFLLLGFSIFLPNVMAAPAMPTGFTGFFVTPEPTQDLAHMMLDLVFGVPDMFNSCVSTGDPCYDTNGYEIVDESGAWILDSLSFPFPIHHGLHAMLRLYSIGLLVVAFMITFYYIITIVAETAQTGTAFGKRFNKVWAPIRIVVAFGLLIPIASGLNSAQYIVLYAAKFGSAFATNGWTIFYSSFTSENPYLRKEELISQPNAPEINALLQFMYVASVCYELEKIDTTPQEIDFYLVKGPQAHLQALRVSQETSYEELIGFLGGDKQAIIRFGVQNKNDYPSQMGYVQPICGQLILPITDSRDPDAADPKDRPERGFEIMQRYYWYVIKELWFIIFDPDGGYIPPADLAGYTENYPLNTAQRWTQSQQDEGVWKEQAPAEYRSALQKFYKRDLEAAMLDPASTDLTSADPRIGNEGALEEQRNSARWNAGIACAPGQMCALREKGWAGAGIWYNRIAEMNGALTTAVLALPMPTLYPEVMEYVAQKKQQQDEGVNANNRFMPKLANGQGIEYPVQADDTQKARALWVGFDYWNGDGFATTTHTDVSGNFLIDSVNYLLGTSGLFNMRKNSEVHPLAQLVGIGRSLIEASIRNFGAATIGSAVGLAIPAFSGFANMAINMLMTISTLTMTVGFVLFYVVPFLPFIYFFFAVAGWIKSIFEAMVGVPLWALAHIRIDGEGLPGKAALNGYFLIFEIFLRPILIVFGLLASLQIFSAMVKLLNETWTLVVSNLTGFDSTENAPNLMDFFRSPIDEFFFTVLYAIIVYLIGMSAFKLIDQLANHILRWMGSGVKTFGQVQEDPAQGLIGATSMGVGQFSNAAGGAVKGGLQSIAKGLN